MTLRSYDLTGYVLALLISLCSTTLQAADKSAPQALHGIDVSHYQGPIKWKLVATDNISFAYIKATDGMTYQDPSFFRNTQQASQAGIAVGPYHFFEPEDDPKKQLDNFYTALSRQKQDFQLTPMVDVEITRGRSAEQIKSSLHAFLLQLEAVTGCTPIIYSYGDYYRANIGASFNRYPFWLADYARHPDIPRWLIWQYSQSGKVDGITGKVDMDTMRSADTLEQLRCNYQAAR